MKLLLLTSAVSILLFYSCASTGFLMAKAQVSMYTDAYPAKSEDAQIDIYRTQRPEQDYLELGEITCADTNDEWALEQTLIKAREIGADAIIILGSAGAYGVGVPVGETMVYTGAEDYGLKAIAIRYQDQ